MSSTSTCQHQHSIGFFGYLTLILVVFKIAGKQFPNEISDWSWWTVFMPVIIQTVFVFLVAVVDILVDRAKGTSK